MRRLYCLALGSCFLATAALAQEAGTETMPSASDIANKDMVTIAIGVGETPDYVGSDDYRAIPAAAIRGKLSGYSFFTNGTYLYLDGIAHRGASKIDIDAGPIVGFRLNRTAEVDDPVVKLLPERRKAIEGGAFVGVSLHGLVDPYDTLALRLDVLHDLANAHKSTTFGPNVTFSTPLSLKTYASLSAGAEFVSNRFADYYFSIDPSDSARSGLPVFNANGGMKDWKVGLLLNQSITGNLLGGFSVFGTGQYSRLVGDFKRSPIVSERGAANQWLGVAGLAYTW